MKKICLGKLSSVGNGKLSLWNAIIQTTCKRPYNDVKAWSQRWSEEENKIILRVPIFPFSLSTCQLQCNKCNVPLIYTPPTYFSQRYIKDITHNPWENKWLNCHRRYVKFEHCKCGIERDTHRENVCVGPRACLCLFATCRAWGPRGLRNTTSRISGSRLSRMSRMMTSQADTELSMLANTKYKRCCFRKGLREREHFWVKLKNNRSATICEILSRDVFSPYYSSPEEAEKHVESEGAPDYKVVDPCPVPCVQSKLEWQREVTKCV